MAQKEWLFTPQPHLRLIGDLMEFCAHEMPDYKPLSVSGYHIREAGSTAVQELAYTLANGFAYVELGLSRHIDVDTFAPQLSFFFDAHIDFFEEIAKFRAARRIWAHWMRDVYGAKTQRAQWLRFHTQTAGVSLTAQQPDNNVVRTAVEALAAVLGCWRRSTSTPTSNSPPRRECRASRRSRRSGRAASSVSSPARCPSRRFAAGSASCSRRLARVQVSAQILNTSLSCRSPAFVEAAAAFERGDYEAAERAYLAILANTPADQLAAGALAGVRLFKRAEHLDAQATRAAAEAARDDVDAQLAAADVDMLEGLVDQAFKRLVDVVARTSGADRDRARVHLLGLFDAAGLDDPSIPAARTALSRALF